MTLKLKGRALDFLVATKIMGWTELESFHRDFPDDDLVGQAPGSKYYGATVPRYSTNMGLAMEVVYMLGEKGHTMHLEWKGADREYPNSVEVQFSQIYTTGHAVGDNVAQAICLAALETTDTGEELLEENIIGPQLDARIAGRVFDAVVDGNQSSIDPDSEDTWIVTPRYSIDIRTTWDVVSVMWGKGYEFSINRIDVDNHFLVVFTKVGKDSVWKGAVSRTSFSPASAICLAALAALDKYDPEKKHVPNLHLRSDRIN